jgi:hypothetical protein
VPPSYVTSSFASFVFTVAVCGMELAISASCASGVPGMETSTFALGLSGGIFAKSGGSLSAGTNVNLLDQLGAVNQRPEISA